MVSSTKSLQPMVKDSLTAGSIHLIKPAPSTCSGQALMNRRSQTGLVIDVDATFKSISVKSPKRKAPPQNPIPH
jgi:hypothetical protein